MVHFLKSSMARSSSKRDLPHVGLTGRVLPPGSFDDIRVLHGLLAVYGILK
jgi:hypothetical protein